MSDDRAVSAAWPTLSRPVRWIGFLALPWFFGILLLAEALNLIGPNGQAQVRIPVLVLALLPGLTFVLARWLGRVPGLRWMHDPVQPRLTIAADGLHLQLPHAGVRAFDWRDIGGLRMRPNHTAHLLGRDGEILARLPESLVMAGSSWTTTESIASLVVRHRPDLFRLSGANWAGEPNEFTTGAADDAEDDQRVWARRRLATAIGLAIIAAALALLFGGQLIRS